MNAEQLIALGTAKGIDFKQVAGNASKLDGAARLRVLTAAERKLREQEYLSLNVEDTVKGQQSRVYRRPKYSVAELAMSVCELERMPWLAVQYSIARHCDDYGELHRGLMLKAIRMAESQKWPYRMQREDGLGDHGWYLAPLAGLVLDSDAHKHLFLLAPTLYSAYMRVSEETWAAKLAPLYRELARQHESWVSAGIAWAQRRINLGVEAQRVVAVAAAEA